jgi:hypothetical protein
MLYTLIMEAAMTTTTLTTKARDNAGNEYEARIAMRNGRPVLAVAGTPGQWYLDTARGRLSLAIDVAQDWWLANADELVAEADRLLAGGAR